MQLNRTLILVSFLFALAVPAAAQTTINADNGVDTVILASTENYPDAMMAAPAAKKLGIPILLTDKDELPEATRQALQRFNPSEVVLVGGEAVIAAEVEASLASDYEVTRLWGTTRYGTAVEIVERFWVEGADEAILIQNELQDQRGTMLAAAKELAREEEAPVYLTPNDGVPAVVLSSLQDLGVEEVTLIGPSVSDAYRASLNDIGVSVADEISGEDDDAVEEEVERRTRQHVNASTRLMAVATAEYRHSLTAANPEGFRVVHVEEDEDIADLVALVNEHDISLVKVVGQPELAEQAAETLREQTDADVTLTVARAAEVVRANANLSEDDFEQYREAHKKRVAHWKKLRADRMDAVRDRANASIQRADDLIDENSSEKAQRLLTKARLLFDEGDYFDAREAAHKAASEERQERYRERSRDSYEEVEEMIREETESLQERVQELQKLNSEFAEEMRENMTVEERLETIQEFRDERREVIAELVKEAQKRRGDIRDRLRHARDEVKVRDDHTRFKFETGCTDESGDGFDVTRNRISGHDGRISVRGRVLMPDPNYRAAATFETADHTIDATIALTGTDAFGIQCVGVGEYRYEIDVAAGNWTVNYHLAVGDREVYSTTETVVVARDDDDGDEQEKEAEHDEKEDDRVDDVTAAERCRLQIERATAAAAEHDVCTEKTQLLECPKDDDVTYQAANGCEISSLQELGWTAAEAGDDETSSTNDETDDSTNDTTTTPENLVEYTADGFTSASVTIQEGETVTWVRSDEAPDMWVASAVHPSHEEYDGTSRTQHCENQTHTTFDQCGTGDRYAFTFNKVGEWSYHNHVGAGTGTVVVESSGEKTRR